MLTKTKTSCEPAGRKPRVGDSVQLQLARSVLEGRITEDRGPIGVGGARLYRIEAEVDPGVWIPFELPASEFTLLADR